MRPRRSRNWVVHQAGACAGYGYRFGPNLNIISSIARNFKGRDGRSGLERLSRLALYRRRGGGARDDRRSARVARVAKLARWRAIDGEIPLAMINSLPGNALEISVDDVNVTSKGQVTIPRDVRQLLGIIPQSEVEFVVEGNTVILRTVTGEAGRGKRLVETLRGRATVRMTTDEIMALTRGEG